MKGPLISNAEIAVVERLHKMWKKLEASSDKFKQSKAVTLSYTICATVPRLILEIRRLREEPSDTVKEETD